MEMEFFVTPGTDENGTSTGSTPAPAGTSTSASSRNRHYEHPKEKLHYSKRTVDIEYKFGFPGFRLGELEGIANRTDYDLSAHSKHSGEDPGYFNRGHRRGSTCRTSSNRPPA